MTIYNRTFFFKAMALAVMLLLAAVAVAGCVGTTTVPRGWSGGVVSDNTLYIGSMAGKLVAVETGRGNLVRAVTLESLRPSSGGFGCAPASSAVAIYGSPATAGDLVYVAGYNGIVYAFAPDRSEPRWVYPRQGTVGAPIVGGCVVSQGRVYFGAADGSVYALDAAEGYKDWVSKAGNKIWSTPTIDGDTLYIGSFDKKLHALNATDGSSKWEFPTDGAIASTPLVDNGTVYIGSFDRHLYAVNAADGSLKWKFMGGNWFWAEPLLHNDAIYAPCLDGKVYILDASTGDRRGEIDLGSPVSSSPVLAGNTVVVATEEGVVYGIDTTTNQQKWINDSLEKGRQSIYASLSGGAGKVYVHSSKDELHALDVQSGVEVWSISLKS